MKSERVVDPDGAVKFYNENGKLHREDGPAVEYCHSHHGGGYRWFYDGQKHRTDGPAVCHSDGTTEWWVNGKRHRIDGPAIQSSFEGGDCWFFNDKKINCSSQEEFIRLINLKIFW